MTTISLIRQCEKCGKSAEKLLKCGKCKGVRYCDIKCQTNDWKEHKIFCKRTLEVSVKDLLTYVEAVDYFIADTIKEVWDKVKKTPLAMTLVDVNPFLRDFFIIKGELTHIPINSPLCVLFNNKTIPSNIKAKLSYFSYDSDYWFPLSIGIGATEGLFMVPFKCRLVDTLTEKVVSKNKIQRENYKNECPWKKNNLQILDRYVAKREDDPTIFVICDVREGNHIMVILT